MRKVLKRIPKFKNESEERRFWQTHDSTDYVDYKIVKNWRFPNLKLTNKPITIRLPQVLIDRVKIKAHRKDMHYQSLIKEFIFQGLGN